MKEQKAREILLLVFTELDAVMQSSGQFNSPLHHVIRSHKELLEPDFSGPVPTDFDAMSKEDFDKMVEEKDSTIRGLTDVIDGKDEDVKELRSRLDDALDTIRIFNQQERDIAKADQENKETIEDLAFQLREAYGTIERYKEGEKDMQYLVDGAIEFLGGRVE